MPDVLLHALDVDPELLDLYLQLSLLKKTAQGLEKVKEKYSFLNFWSPMVGKLPQASDIGNSCECVKDVCVALANLKFFDRIWSIREDIFGAYFYKQCRIELYWMAIGVMAADLECTPEALTQVVAIHELAHAYTHIGFDIDDRAWETSHFGRTDDEVVEGLAQFFTRAVCERLASRYPETLKAYESLLERQPAPYKAQLGWVEKDEAGGEIIRSAMILFRSHSETSHERFMDMIHDTRDRLGRRSKNGNHTVIQNIFG